MSHATYIVSNNQDEILNYILLESKIDAKKDFYTNPDVKIVTKAKDKKSIGINQIKALKQFVNERPLQSKFKVLYVPEAQSLTVESQNAMLKLSEEPPEHLKIFLSSWGLDGILDTVVSRCTKIYLKNENPTNNISKLYPREKIASASILEKLTFAEEIAKEEREDVAEYLKWLLMEERREFKKNTDTTFSNNAGIILGKLADLQKTNVSARLLLEDLFLHLVKTP